MTQKEIEKSFADLINQTQSEIVFDMFNGIAGLMNHGADKFDSKFKNFKQAAVQGLKQSSTVANQRGEFKDVIEDLLDNYDKYGDELKEDINTLHDILVFVVNNDKLNIPGFDIDEDAYHELGQKFNDLQDVVTTRSYLKR